MINISFDDNKISFKFNVLYLNVSSKKIYQTKKRKKSSKRIVIFYYIFIKTSKIIEISNYVLFFYKLDQGFINENNLFSVL